MTENPMEDSGRGGHADPSWPLLQHPFSRRRLLQYAGAAGATAMLPTLLSACGDDGEAAFDDLAFEQQLLPDVYDVTKVEIPGTATILPGLEPILIADAATGESLPNVAEDFEQLDPVTWRLRVRSGVTYWDGTELTPEDVAFSMQLHADPKNESALLRIWSNARSIEVDGNDVVVTLKEPRIGFTSDLTLTGVIQKQFWQEAGREIGKPQTLNLGTGPYEITEFTPAQRIAYERYEDYWGEKPSIRSMVLTFLEDPNAELASVRAGETTGNFNIPPGNAAQYEGLDSVEVYSTQDPSLVTVFFNPNLPPFDDVHVRRAVAHSIDKEGIIQSIYDGNGTVAQTMVASTLMEQVMAPEQVEQLYSDLEIPFDLEAARSELAESKMPDGFEAEVVTPTAEPDLRDLAQALASSLSEIGITLTAKEIPTPQYDETIFFGDEKTQPIGIVNFGVFSLTPWDQPIAMLSPRNIPPSGYQNLAAFDSPELGRLFDELERLSPKDDQERIGEILGEVLTVNSEQAIYASVLFGDEVLALDNAYNYVDWAPGWLLGPWYKQIEAA
jgi:peptide/nickel transport system substrate-binding protein